MRLFATGWSEGFDGPGRRLVLYAKGCNLRCRWCANPEGLAPEPQMLFYARRGRDAAHACPRGAVEGIGPAARLDRSRCAECAGRPCVEVSKHPAFERAGADRSPDEILCEALRARALFGRSGGVTFGGGEATMQIEPLVDACDRLTTAGIDVAVESNSSTPGFGRLVGRPVLLVADLKCVDGALHRAWTGGDNAAVLENLQRTTREHGRVLLRVPLVTGMNDGDDEAARVAAFVGRLAAARASAGRGRMRLEVLPLHHAGAPKYAALGLAYAMEGVPVPADAAVRRFVESLEAHGVAASVGTQDRGGGT